MIIALAAAVPALIVAWWQIRASDRRSLREFENIQARADVEWQRREQSAQVQKVESVTKQSLGEVYGFISVVEEDLTETQRTGLFAGGPNAFDLPARVAEVKIAANNAAVSLGSLGAPTISQSQVVSVTGLLVSGLEGASNGRSISQENYAKVLNLLIALKATCNNLAVMSGTGQTQETKRQKDDK